MSKYPLHDLARRYESRFARTFLSEALALQERITDQLVAEVMARGLVDEPMALYELIDAMRIAKSEEDVYAALIAEAGKYELKLHGLGRLAGMFKVTSPFVLQAASRQAANLVTGVSAETKRAIRRIIFESIRDGHPPVKAARTIRNVVGLTERHAIAVQRFAEHNTERGTARYARKLLNLRANNIARTETIRASSVGQQTAWREMARSNLIDTSRFRERWLVTDDDRLCFPAGTKVRTPNGGVPVESLRMGDLVCTPDGDYPVTGTMHRCYDDAFTYWATDNGWSLATEDHLVWRQSQWIMAKALTEGDMLDCGGDDGAQVRCVRRVILGHAQHPPASGHDFVIARKIADRVGVPVSAVHFDDKAMVKEGEVGTVATDLEFMSHADTHVGQDGSDTFLGARLAAMPSVTGRRTELSLARRRVAERSPAFAAVGDARRSPAFLRAIFADAALRWEGLTTPRAIGVTLDSALPGANGVAMSDRGWYRELLSAGGAMFRYSLARCFVALARAKATFGRLLERGAAVLAWLLRVLDRRRVVAGARAEYPRGGSTLGSDDPGSAMGTNVSKRHEVIVYDIQVTGPACFYADGFLVHNCDLCAPMDGMLVALGGSFESSERGVLPSEREAYAGETVDSPPLHPSCRCTLVADFG